MLFRAVTSFHRNGYSATAVNFHVTTELDPRVTLRLPWLSENIGPSERIRNLLLSISTNSAVDKACCFRRYGNLSVHHRAFSSLGSLQQAIGHHCGYWQFIPSKNHHGSVWYSEIFLTEHHPSFKLLHKAYHSCSSTVLCPQNLKDVRDWFSIERERTDFQMLIPWSWCLMTLHKFVSLFKP